ncbi:hypothetical protein ACN1NW_000413 [Acinetobacter baumannii]|nr:hypothetical protein [Acinetobacter baumannii]ELA7031002.1 hypothetical protein [Acinetobacter baumannii]ELA7118765.1 hypothetical protein [Acinetobacter baumannii]ELB0919714.1 hypothetical protein [Acinetobacter baumannii]ELB0965890.1 hypothetical protein [Acinetobacter baumannii]
MFVINTTIEARKSGDNEYELTLEDQSAKSLAKLAEENVEFVESGAYCAVYSFINSNMPYFGDHAENASTLKELLNKAILEGHSYGYQHFGIMLKLQNNVIEYAGIKVFDKNAKV